MEKRISYLNRTYADYKEALIEMSERYYPNMSASFRDSSIGEWQIDIAADVADNLSYHADRMLQETNINSAQEKSSLYSIARNCGVKIPGPKGAMAEVKISVVVPYEEGYEPIIKKGTKFSSGSQQFELLNDVDFADQFDINGNSDRTITPRITSNGIINGYTITKLAVVTAGETKIFSQFLRPSDIKPFMEIILPIEGVMNIESILVRKGNNESIPTYGLFYSSGCDETIRFYEVDNLAQNKCWIEDGKAEIYDNVTMPTQIIKGKWEPIKHKFITEYTDKGYLKIIFGAKESEKSEVNDKLTFNKWQMSRMLNNDNLGILPEPNSTMFILYRVGGGSSSNVAKGAINKISYLNADFRKGKNGTQQEVTNIMNSLRVENTTPSISGKDMPNEAEMRYFIKYHNAAQERCVTVKDSIDRILMLPSKYGTPFRVGVVEENNKIVIYLLGINHNSNLTTSLPILLVDNIKNYIKEYRMINDYIEIKSGRIINLGFDVDVVIDKNYNKNDVISSIINTIEKYMDINKHIMGEEIYIGDLEKEIGKVDGVINLISLIVKNKFGSEYSNSRISQEVIINNDLTNESIIDLEASDFILYNDGDTMMEIKYPEEDIRIRIKER